MGVKRKILLWGILIVVSSIFGYIYHPIITGVCNVLIIGFLYSLIKKRGVKLKFKFNKKVK